MSRRYWVGRVFLVALLLALPSSLQAGSTIQLLNADGAGEGLNDPTPISPVGGNPASTLGEARLQAVHFAAALWAESLNSNVPIVVSVRFDPLGGTETEATLGIGTAADLYRDFAGAPLPATWYPSALADSLAGVDLSGGDGPDIELVFNTDVDGGMALGASRFYYGFDDAPEPGDVGLVAIALHELAHGLGFATYLTPDGEKLLGYDDVFMTHLVQSSAKPLPFPAMTDAQRALAATSGTVVWAGPAAVAEASLWLSAGNWNPDGYIEIYSPLQHAGDLSLNHWAGSLRPFDILQPFHQGDIGLRLCLTAAALEDIGWSTNSGCHTRVLGPTLPVVEVIGEAGSVVVDQSQEEIWTTVSLAGAYTAPVVIAVPSSYSVAEPMTARLRNVTASSFEIRVEEWDYQDGTRPPEVVDYLVFEEGEHPLDDGRTLLVGTTEVNHQWATVPFGTPFGTVPVVLAQVQTTNDPVPVVVRQRNSSASSFQLRLQEEEAYFKTAEKVHAPETVGFVALVPGVGEMSDRTFEAGLTPDSVNQNWFSITFEGTYPSVPIVLGAMQSTDGGDSSVLRVRNGTAVGLEVSVEEEQSFDAEIGHTKEVAGYLVVHPEGLITVEGGS